MEIVRRLCPPERYPLKCPYTRRPDRIVIHNTGNDAPAENEAAYMLRNGREVSFHYAVDEEKAVQCLPLERNAWASGDGLGCGNMRGIHIEICWSLSGGERFARAEENAAALAALLLKEQGWGIGQVTKHQDYDGKYCPHRTLDLGWERFLRMVEAYMKEEAMTYEQFREYMARYEKELAARPASGWASEAWEQAAEKGLLDGTGPRLPLTREQAAVVLGRVL